MKELAVQLHDVSKAFHGQPVLDKVSFSVAKGEAFCLLGRSGTGKSVTLKIIIGLLAQDEGSVSIENDQVQDLDRAGIMRVRKKVGFLFQNAALFDSISLAENLAFPLRRHGDHEGHELTEDVIRETVHTTLAEVGLEADADKMPSDLSGGMRKRAGLARALVMNPEILLVDEPSSGLDRITAGEIYDLLERLKAKKKTLIMVTHDAAGSRRFADRMAVLDQGRIVACGTPEELKSGDNQLAHALIEGANT